MDIQLKKWGNSLGLQIPDCLAESFGWDENSTAEVLEIDEVLAIRKKATALTLNELLASIPADFQYSDDVHDYVE
ncbi:MAG: AbrB/MazE/SpoVT family DNA-binding domain-containing protein [Leptolyngbya sp.]|nr:MAG: AbrB/MazE/SpoVT family DNA-binding domain-containing protein [Leptolyngbya sp.]